MSLYDWNTPQNFSLGDNWGNLSQFQGIAGYGPNPVDVPSMGGGSTFSGGPAWEPPVVAGGGGGEFTPSLYQQMMGYTDPNGIKTGGFAAPALGLLQGGISAFMGMKQYGLAKDALAQSKKQFNMNYNAQRDTTNTMMEDRQRARVASNPGAYQSVGDYMKDHRIN